MRRTRILVADSLLIFRAGVRNLLAREGDFEVVEAASIGDVLSHVGEPCPDIALVDLDLPPRGGVEAVRLLAERCAAHTVVWSFEPRAEVVLAAVRAGARGYLHKEISADGLVRALRGAVHGEAPLARDLASRMIEAIHARERSLYARERSSVLSSREREVLDMISRGARNKQIASALTISEFTVKRHVQNILQKLELPSRRAAGLFYDLAYGHEEAFQVNGSNA